MPNPTMKIDGFECEITHDGELMSCFISQGKCSSSLTLAENMGHIEDIDDRVDPIKIDENTLVRIRLWAESHGY